MVASVRGFFELGIQEYPAYGGGGGGGGLFAGVFLIVWAAIFLLMIVSMWKIFEKAGKPGWAAVVPIYNLIVMLEISGKPLWWFILFLIPFVNFIAYILVTVALAEKFGRGVGFAIGMLLLPVVFFPILGLGDARYRG